MKKLLSLVLVCLLLCCSAAAETREIVTLAEGEEETVVETLYQSSLGFSFWYDADVLTVEADMSESGLSLMIYPPENDLPIYLEIMLPESLGLTAMEILNENADPDTTYVFEEGESGTEITRFQRTSVYNAGGLQCFYAVRQGKNELIAVAAYPQEAEEGFAEDFHRLIGSLFFESLHAAWAGDALPGLTEYDARSLSQDSPLSMIVLSTDQALQSLQLLSLDFLDFDDELGVIYEEEVLYTQDALTPERPLLVTLTFYGDLPEYGVNYTDENGVQHSFTLEISGENGALLLLPR